MARLDTRTSLRLPPSCIAWPRYAKEPPERILGAFLFLGFDYAEELLVALWKRVP